MAVYRPRPAGHPMNRYDGCLQSARHYKDECRYQLQLARNACTTGGKARALERAHVFRIWAAACLAFARNYHPVILPH